MTTIRHRRQTKEQWAASNDVLAAGELGVELGPDPSEDRFKIGNGLYAWSQLKYFLNESELDVDTGRLSKESLDATYEAKGFGSKNSSTEFPPQSGLLVPSTDGLFPDDAVTLGVYTPTVGSQKHGQAVAAFGKLVGQAPVIDHQFYGADGGFPNVDHPSFLHQIPLITWGSPVHSLDQILAGNLDAYFVERAAACKDRGGPILFRPMHEMNGNGYRWTGSQNGANAQATAKYVSVWKRIYDLFQTAGATNVKFVWCPLVLSAPVIANAPWNDAQYYYPGDAYVDYIGVDGYNAGPTTVASPQMIFNTFFTTWSTKSMKFIICETSSADNGMSANGSTDSNQNKAKWISDLSTALSDVWPDVAAVVWTHENKDHNWLVNSSATALASFKTMVNSDRWETLRNRVYQTIKIGVLKTSFASLPSTFEISSGVSVASGVLRITPGDSRQNVYNAALTRDAYDFTASELFLRVTPATGGTSPETQVIIHQGDFDGNDIGATFTAGFAYFGMRSSYGLVNPTSWTFTPGNYIRFKEVKGTMFVADSPDGIVWTERANVSLATRRVDLASVRIMSWNSGGTSTAALFDNFNTLT